MGVISELLARISEITAERESEERSQSMLGNEPLSVNKRVNLEAERKLAEQEAGIDGVAGGKASEEEARKHTQFVAGAVNVKMIMEQHDHFVTHGINSLEELNRFGAMLEDDRYWGFLQENDRERGAVAAAQAEALAGMEPEEQERYFENNPRARKLDAEWRLAMAEYMEDPEKAKEKYGEDYFRGIDDVMGPNFMEDQRKLPPEERHEIFQEREDKAELDAAEANAKNDEAVDRGRFENAEEDRDSTVIAKQNSAQEQRGGAETSVAKTNDVVEEIDWASMGVTPELQREVAQQNMKLQEDNAQPGEPVREPNANVASVQEPSKEAGREMG
ncbi:MAG: hypothetical protein AAF558_09905 [Verrucomicrobiota bacterium]